jgi:hypothetical protein
MRLQSMEAAKSNIDDTLKELQLKASIQRQSDITEELLDVVSGAEVCTGSGGRRFRSVRHKGEVWTHPF